MFQGLPATPAASSIDGVFLPRIKTCGLLLPPRKPAHRPSKTGNTIPTMALKAKQTTTKTLPAFPSCFHTWRENGWARCTRTQALRLQPQQLPSFRKTAKAPVHSPRGAKSCRRGEAARVFLASLRAATHFALQTAHWSSPSCLFTHDLPCGVW